MTWVPLHCHSQYSILDATSSIKDFVARGEELQIPALALTDHGNLYGAIDFYKECNQKGIKPIIGCECYIAPGSRFDKKKEKRRRAAHHIILLCKNEQGYRNLCVLTSRAFTEGFYYFPRIDKDLLSQYSEGLICLSGCLSSSVSEAALKSEEDLILELEWFQNLFKDDYFTEVQFHKMSEDKVASFGEEWLKQEYYSLIEKQAKINTAVLAASTSLGIPTVATNDIHYINPEDWQAHEILLNIQSGETVRIAKQNTHIPNPKRKIYSSREYYFKSPLQMTELFKDTPEVISNTLEVASRCNFTFDFSKRHYPIYIPESLKSLDNYTEEDRYQASAAFLRELVEDSLPKKYSPEVLAHIAKKFSTRNPIDIVKERMEMEMAVIIPKGMCDYLLIVWDIIHWAKANGIPVGPGRGSGAGSVLLFLLGITEIEPIRFDLFFERFINPERLSYPDIDIDICMTGRERVINYAIERHGKDNVAQIITFGTMKAKMAVKDVGRTLDMALSKVNHIAKHIPDLNTTLSKALETDPDLYQLYINDSECTQVIDMALCLEGSIRNTGVHAAGVIICGDQLTNHIPICMSKDSTMITTQYSMKPVESVGMLKVDLLGLKTLTSINIAMSAIQHKTGQSLTMATLPLDDTTTFSLLHQGKTMGIFQMESKGMQELAKNLRPDLFEEIIAIGALYRPGPMDMIPSFINRKHGKETIEYDHPLMESILQETYGIMVYQEQVMQIAGALASYSLGEGDVLRRAMGKKDARQMEQEREKFCKRACNNGIDLDLATTIFDKMEKFASYGFNKSHAAAYGLITYTTAYLKANYPKEWLAALLTSDSDDIEKVGKLIREAQSMGIPILPPDINVSSNHFVATNEGIRFAMGAIKGIGRGLIDSIVEERDLHGPYQSIRDFIQRSDLKKVSKKNIESLIDAGCFDCFEANRDLTLASVEPLYEAISKEKKEAASGVMTFFALGTMHDKHEIPLSLPKDIIPRSKKEILKKEKELLGIYLTEHPMDAVRNYFSHLSVVLAGEFENLSHGSVIRTVFIIDKVTTKVSSKAQKKFAVLRVNDGIDSYELPIWPDMYEEQQELLEEDRLIYAIIVLDKRNDSLRFSCRWMRDLSVVNENIIYECDQAFDKIKTQVQKMSFSTPGFVRENKIKVGKPNESSQMPTSTPLTLSLDLNELRHSHLCILKEIIQRHPGSRALLLIFTQNNEKIASVFPDDAYFVSENIESLQKELTTADLPIQLITV
ncbi:DNA polymerase III subunit alpha,DNA polymerase III subunit alpha,DNA polymerase III, alpha subunit,Bacterial DNA polymerase III alpha subunit [Chlamydia serpentis]|uniref:DNA polymerase III subunit alpha n=1 Tax=Chlamydia serpentis TaxID=1967782 RepID=A0A2R8FBI6_9CHLA|nr:DNA polymerase III subunit alpha [Chlamydia serpentis]SPN73785.1 DNA polymerase III subunit alpha,DNA polymerase III subunit alpha,DNA polymerase III, alpha subunit,Bacterial DNA polymerase III alpha subunit [Chlamydia serpentis]